MLVLVLMCSYCLLFQDENLQRCSISADSRIENSGSDDSSDDENTDVKENGYHDAENEVDQETDYDAERVLSGKLSESSGSGGSDLYEYKVVRFSLAHIEASLYISHLSPALSTCSFVFMNMH